MSEVGSGADAGPELSSIRTALDDLGTRVTAMAEGLTGGPEERVAQDLFHVERLLQGALRRLEKLDGELNRSRRWLGAQKTDGAP